MKRFWYRFHCLSICCVFSLFLKAAVSAPWALCVTLRVVCLLFYLTCHFLSKISIYVCMYVCISTITIRNCDWSLAAGRQLTDCRSSALSLSTSSVMRGAWLDATDSERCGDPFLSDPSLSGEDDGEGGRWGRSLLTKSPGGGNDFFCKYCQQNAG